MSLKYPSWYNTIQKASFLLETQSDKQLQWYRGKIDLNQMTKPIREIITLIIKLIPTATKFWERQMCQNWILYCIPMYRMSSIIDFTRVNRSSSPFNNCIVVRLSNSTTKSICTFDMIACNPKFIALILANKVSKAPLCHPPTCCNLHTHMIS